MEVQYVWCGAARHARPRPGHSRQSWGGDDRRGHSDSYTAASCPGAALPTLDMPGPALARNIGAEEMEYSSTWSDRIQVYADAKKYDVLRRIHNAIIVEIRSILWCRCRHVWQVTVGTSRSTRKDDIVLMGGCGYFGGNYKEQHPGAALPAPSLPCPGQCGGVWWWREQWTWRWRR